MKILKMYLLIKRYEEMRLITFSRSAVSALLLTLFFNSSVNSQTSEEYLTVAKKTAHWISSLEIADPVSGGISWKFREGSIGGGGASYCSGAAGIGTFFLKLYKVTGESQYLTKAKKTGYYISSSQIASTITATEWFYGAAGAGIYFIDLYNETRDQTFLQNAKYYGEYLFENKQHYKEGYYWKYFTSNINKYTGIAHGNAGIGLFLVRLYELTGQSVYLNAAEKAFTWMTYYTVTYSDNSLGWKRLTTDNSAYHLWCGGSTGIIFFLKKMYEITGKSIYREYLENTANGLIRHAVNMDNGHAWHYSSSTSTSIKNGLPIIYCHGASSVSHALYEMYSVTQNTEYLYYARSGAKWVMNNKIKLKTDAYYWRHFYDYDRVDTGLFTGIASVGHGFLECYEFDKKQEYVEHAIYAANCLIEIAKHPTGDQICWQVLYRGHKDSEDWYYKPGWYSGAAGIGIFFLELYEVLNNQGTSVQPEEKISESYKMLSSYPNPFNSSCTILFNLHESCEITIKIFSVSGKKIRTLTENTAFSIGWNQITWNAFDDSNLPAASGVYIVSLISDEYSASQKIILLK